MTNLALIESPDDMPALSRLAVMKKEAKKTIRGNGVTVYETSMDHAMQIGLDVTQFYEELINRDVSYSSSMKAEEIKVALKSGNSSPFGSRPQSMASSRPNSRVESRLGSTGNISIENTSQHKISRSSSMPFEAGGAKGDFKEEFFDGQLPNETTGHVMSELPTALSMPLNFDGTQNPPGSAAGGRENIRVALKELL